MKKLLTILFICGCLSMSFTSGNCSAKPSIVLFYAFIRSCLFAEFLDSYQHAVSYNYGIAIGNNGIILKTSGSDTINFQPRTSGTSQNLNSADIKFQRVLVAGNSGTILRSTNSGETWNVIPPVTSVNLNAVRFGYAGYDYAVGDNGVILRGSNSGLNWAVMPSGTTRKLTAVSVHSSGQAFVIAAGEKGTILRSTNSGQSWINVSLPDTTINFNCINPPFAMGNEIFSYYIAGTNGRIYKSTNQGATWVLKNSGTSNSLHSIYFSTPDSGAVTGDNGTVRMTTNGGDSWFTDPYFSGVSGTITSISQMPRSERTFTAVSNNNTLYIAAEDTNLVIIGIKNISSEIPREFTLSQNYPNPFNPSTKFKVQISKSSDVKIVIFDVTGKELETLVNEQLKPGTYEIDFNGSRFSSGVYFYKLIAGDYIETRKMMLVK
jgi:hypothetical protein